MVLEGLVAALVQTFCSRFNLRIELSGEITLSNIELKLDEFESLQLPIGPKRIHIGHLRSNVVAAQLTNQPLHIQAADVTILMGTPSSHDDSLTDTVADMDAAHQAKIDWIQRLLTDTDDIANTRLPGNGPPPTSGASRWLRLFLDAFVSLERLHVCVVDSASGCSAGLRLDTMLMQPATANPLDATIQQVFSKIIQVTNVSLYVEESKLRAATSASDEPTAAATPATEPTTHCVVCFGAMAIALTIPSSTLQIQASVTIPPPAAIHVNLSLSHLQLSWAVLHGLDSAVRASLYRRFRPATSRPISKATARDWWHYAVFATLLQQNDPVFRRPSWSHTINLVLVGLQYTAVRRAILPYLQRAPFDDRNGAAGGYNIRNVERLRVNDMNVSALPLAMAAALDSLPSDVTHYGNAVFAGIYGWKTPTTPGLQPTDASTADTTTNLRHLWSRQLYLDACFRPIIAAKLRLLANDQIRKREQARNERRDLYNKRRGTLVVTVVDCSWRDGSLHRSLLHAGLAAVHVKVGNRGKAYVGTPVPCQGPAPECCGCTPTTDNASPTTCIFGQSFEFRLRGTPDEDFVHISIQDDWVFPYLHQESTTATLALAACTAASHTNNDVALLEDRGHVRLITTFLSTDDQVDAADVQATALAHFNELYPEIYAKQHTWTSWYTPTIGVEHGLAGPGLLPTLYAVEAVIPVIQVQIQLGLTTDSAFRIHFTNVTGRYRASIADANIQVRVESVECVSGHAGTASPWLVSTTRPALDVVMAKPTRTRAQSTVTVGAITVTASVPMLLLLYTTVVQWKDVAMDVLTLLYAPIYGPFGVWVAPPAVNLPRTPDTITTNLHLADVSLCVDEVGTWFAPPSKLVVVTQGNATSIKNAAGRSVAKLHWELWQSFLRHVSWAWSQPDMAGPLDAPLVDEWQREAGSLWLAQGLSVLKHHTHRGLPQERIVWLQEDSLFIGKTRFKSTSRVRELPLPDITQIVAGRSSTALERTGTAASAALYLTLVCADRPVSVEFTAVNIRQLVQRTLADLVVASRRATN